MFYAGIIKAFMLPFKIIDPYFLIVLYSVKMYINMVNNI